MARSGACTPGAVRFTPRLKYGELYDELRNNERVLTNDLDVWRGMAIAEQGERLDHADRVRLRELVTRATQVNANVGPNYDYVVRLAEALHLKPIRDTILEHTASEDSFCKPLLANE